MMSAMISKSSISFWVIIGIALLTLGFCYSCLSGFYPGDEAWFLQVVHRMGKGEVLYRDIFFGVTPLSVYITQAFTLLFGYEILAVKAVNALSFALTILLCCRILVQLTNPAFKQVANPA